MSVKHNRAKAIAAGQLEALRASILAEVEEKNAATEESIISSIRSNLISPPKDGEEWNDRKSYITGDVVTYGGKKYAALRYSRGKAPADHPEEWAEVPEEEKITAWEEIPDGEVIEKGTFVTYKGKKWVCTAQHIKSPVYSPRAASAKWETAE